MMLSARVLIVSDRPEVAAELQPLIQSEQHLAGVVADGRELLDLLEAGLIPDILVSDLGSPGGAAERGAYVARFRELNGAGCHLVIADGGAAEPGPGELRRPFDPPRVREQLGEALRRVEREIHATRTEVWRSLERLRREVDGVRADMVRVLARTIAARDPYMDGHAERVGETAARMAAALGLEEEARARLRTAAQLHEIGKVSVPVELLQKTDPLSPEELERIRAHARTGALILRDVPCLAEIAPLVEHLGTPYAELPSSADALLVGILRVADVWDAVTHERSYRASLPRNDWEPLLRQGAGTSFDPRAVAALFRVLDER